MTDSTNRVIKIQTILYQTDWSSIDKFFNSMATQEVSPDYEILLHVGDCSPEALLDQKGLKFWQSELAKSNIRLEYTFFDANLGFARGNNTLFRQIPPPGEQLLLINPDAVIPFHLVSRLRALAEIRSDYGIIEARQIPLEHPKAFDLVSYETGWATGACMLCRVEAFEKCGGFDENFFMYCEDVDLSWRMRAAGYKVYYCPDTFIYHSKRMMANGIESGWAERHYGLISTMLLHAKYDRIELNTSILEWARVSGFDRAVEEYEKTLKKLKPASSAEKKVAEFNSDGTFARHRWHYQEYKVEV